MATQHGQGGTRQAFQRQPARAVLVDFHCDMDQTTCLNLQQALSNTLTLLHSIAGPTRMPFFALFMLTSYPECVLPLQPVKSSQQRITSALNELRVFARSRAGRVLHGGKGCLLDGMKEALAQFNRLAQNYRQGSAGSITFPSQIELTLVTSQAPRSLQRQVEEMADQLDLEHLKKISAVCVSDPEKLTRAMVGEGVGEEEGVTAGGSQFYDVSSSQAVTSSPSELGLSILDLVAIDNDVLSLQNVFCKWLHDCGMDSEHLHLTLPPATSGGNSPLIIKCDLQERILDPSLFGPNITQNFILRTAGHVATSGRGSTAGGSAHSLPVYKLQVLSVVPENSVCESVLYGLPHLLLPTTCWKLDWEELENNQQHFSALCLMLQEKGMMLLACAEHPSSPLKPHFLILPSPSLTLLIKSVAVSELLLPADLPASDGERPTLQAQENLMTSLDQLEVQESFNPLLVPSGLLQSLSMGGRGGRASLTSRTRTATGLTTTRVFQAPVKKDAPQGMSDHSHGNSSRGNSGRSLGLKKGAGSHQKGGVAHRGN